MMRIPNFFIAMPSLGVMAIQFEKIHDEEGNWYHEQEKLKSEAIKYFSKHFKEEGGALILDQIQVIQHFPSFLSVEDASNVGREYSLLTGYSLSASTTST